MNVKLIICAILIFLCFDSISSAWQIPALKKGKASYYADRFHGRRTANGEKYQTDKLTAAHKSLPFGTKVRVTNIKNNKSVVVRINDRGPVSRYRVLDLSRKAAEEIDMIKAGVIWVMYEIIEEPKPKARKKK